MWEEETLGAKYHYEEIPAHLRDQAEEYRILCLKILQMLMMLLWRNILKGKEISPEEIRKAIREATCPIKTGSSALRISFQKQKSSALH